MRDITLRSIILCDHVSRSRDGQVNAMGIYSNIVRCDTRPALIRGSLLANFVAEPGEEARLDIRTKGPRASGTGTTEVDGRAAYFNIEAPLIGLVEKDDVVSFEWRVDEGEWRVGATWKVQLTPDVHELGEEDDGKIRKLFSALVDASDILSNASLRSAGPNSESIPPID